MSESGPTPIPKRSVLTGSAVAGVWLTVAPLLASSALTYAALTHEAALNHLSPWGWIGLTVACCLTSVVALTPPTLLALVFGYFLGWAGVVPLFVLNMVAIWLVNVAVRRLDQDRLRQFLTQQPKTLAMLGRIRQQELRFIFFAKLSPILPFGLTNLVFALSGARLRNILLGGFAGMVPRTVLAVWAGSQARQLRTLLDSPNANSWSQVALLVLLLVSLLGMGQVLRRATASVT